MTILTDLWYVVTHDGLLILLLGLMLWLASSVANRRDAARRRRDPYHEINDRRHW